MPPSSPWRPSPWRVAGLYAGAIVKEFRWTLALLAAAVLLGAAVYRGTPHDVYGAQRTPAWLTCFYGGWMALLAQPIINPPPTPSLQLLCAVYPLLGLVLIGEGVVRFAILMVSKRHGERAWMKVTASTYRGHVVLCGLGHLGYRVLEQLVATGTPVVVLEKHKGSRQLVYAREHQVPVLIRDMKEDQALIDAGIPHARAVIVCTNDDMANLEVALDSRRMNPAIRVILRLYDQQIAQKIKDALTIDVAFSSSALAAPIVAAMSLETRVLSTYLIADVAHVTAEVKVEAGSALADQLVREIERRYGVRVLSDDADDPVAVASAGDTLVIHAAASKLAAFAAAGREDSKSE